MASASAEPGRLMAGVPRTDRQVALCALFAEVFGVPDVGLHDDFFDLGGRSVEAVLLAGRIGATFRVRVSMADVFDAPTVAQLEQRIDFGVPAADAPTGERTGAR